MIAEILSFSWAFLISVFAIPSIIYVAHLKNLLDSPDGGRRVHEVLTPRLGGLAIFAGFMSALMIFGDLSGGVQHLLAGCIILFFIGLKDDMVDVSAFKKFFVQILATGIVMFMADIRITSFQGIFNIHELPIGISYSFTFLVIIGITNAVNLIDGLDGLAGSLIFIASLFFGYFFYTEAANDFIAYSVVAFCLAGGILGFLRYNFKNAIIFMGDTGSLVCGFILAVLAIQMVEMRSVESAPSIAISLLYIPVFDTLRVFLARILAGQSPFMPDKNHIHHLLLKTGLTQTQTVFYLTLLSVAIVLFSFFFSQLGNLFLIIIQTIVFLVFTVVVYKVGKNK